MKVWFYNRLAIPSAVVCQAELGPVAVHLGAQLCCQMPAGVLSTLLNGAVRQSTSLVSWESQS